MARAHCIPGVFFLTCATVLLILVSISLPAFTAMDITRVHYQSNAQPSIVNQTTPMRELRFGIWAYCFDAASDGTRTCKNGRAYTVQLQNPTRNQFIDIRSSWTTGLAVHPVAAGVSAVALLLGLSTHLTLTLLASLTSFLAALLTLIAFAIDIALFAFAKHEMDNLDIGAKTITAPGFWLTFASLILLLLGGCTVCFGHRRDRAAGGARMTESYPMGRDKWYHRFRRN